MPNHPRAALSLATLSLAIATLLLPFAIPASAQQSAPPAATPQTATEPAPKYPPLKCRIGKPSYCFKYGGSRCLEINAVPNRTAACADWTEACLECHRDIPDCFGKVRPLAGSAKCAECEQQWHDCMHRIDAKYWPDRLKPTPDD